MFNINNNAIISGRLTADPYIFNNSDGSRKIFLTVASPNAYRNKDTSVNIFARSQGDAGAAWRQCLSDDRKRMGDFACYIALFEGIEVR